MKTILRIKLSQREKYILDEAVKILEKYLHPDKILLFGSRAKSNDTRGSDFDIAVCASNPGIRTERIVNEEIEGISGLYHIDVVYLDSVDSAFREVVTTTGITIYEKGNQTEQ